MKKTIRFAAFVAALMSSGLAHAAITCSVTSGGFATAYDAAAPSTNVTPTFFTVTCTKGSAGDPPTVPYSVKVNNGLYPTGGNNRAAFGAARIRYDTYTNATCGTKWQGATAISGTVATPSVGTFTQTSNYWGCVGAGIAAAAGTYTDTVTMTMTYGAFSSTATGAFGVTITTPPTCAITAAIPNIVFNYVSFGAAVNPSYGFGVTCSLALSYTMALSATTGTIAGLNYAIALSTASSVGTGAQQTHFINGTMAAGQGGTCGLALCSGSQTRSLTITY